MRGHCGSPEPLGCVDFLGAFGRTGAKKNRQARLAVFREFRVLRTYDSPLSIRQRLEMPKEIKIKLGGHGGSETGREKWVVKNR
jgi:hypothetical protein